MGYLDTLLKNSKTAREQALSYVDTARTGQLPTPEQPDTILDDYNQQKEDDFVQSILGDNTSTNLDAVQNLFNTVNPPSISNKTKLSSITRGGPKKPPLPAFTPDATTPFNSSVDMSEPREDVELANAIKTRNEKQLTANLGSAASSLGAAIAGAKTPDLKFFDTLNSQAEQSIDDVKTTRDQKDKAVARKLKLADLEDEKSMRDPNSEVSKTLREGVNMFNLLGSKVGPNVSGRQLRDSGINLGSLIAAKEAADSRALQLTMSREVSSSNRNLAQNARAQNELEKKTTALADKMSKGGYPDAIRILNDIDAGVGGLDDQNKKDLPGYGVGAGLVPDLLTSEKGRALRQSIRELSNIKLKDRSGAAVTVPEFDRFVGEMGTGTWGTEDQLRKGLKAYRDKLMSEVKAIEASASTAVKEEYVSRDGHISSTQIPSKKTISVVKKQYSESRNKTKLIYSDGSEELVDGKQ